MKIRDFTAGDIGPICKLRGQLWPDIDVNTAQMRRCLECGLQAANQRYLCAVLDDEVVGFCSLNVKNNLWQQGFVGHVDELMVGESHRRKGQVRHFCGGWKRSPRRWAADVWRWIRLTREPRRTPFTRVWDSATGGCCFQSLSYL